MNAPARKPKADEAETAPNPNLDTWLALSKTDPKHTKSFQRAGGFKGTAIKPIWIVQRLTELFGPVGKGWGMGQPTFQTVEAAGEVLVYCTVECWHGQPENRFYGVGGDKAVAKRANGPNFADDEAFKKAFTDAVGNAFKFLGVGADVHMGLFEDSKYLKAVTSEFAEAAVSGAAGDTAGDGAVSSGGPQKGWREPDSPYSTPTKLHQALNAMDRELMACGDSDMVYALTATDEWKEFVRVAEIRSPHYLHGGEPAPPEFEGLVNKAARLVAEFDSTTADEKAALIHAG